MSLLSVARKRILPRLRLLPLLFANICATACLTAQSAPHPLNVSFANLPTNERNLFNASIQLADQRFDSVTHLLRTPTASPDSPERLVRESAWCALALLERDRTGDRSQAIAILDVVLAQQYLDPSTKWYGTFKRSPDEPLPPSGIISHAPGILGYDPNWREFIGTIFEIILIEYPDRIPAALAARLDRAIDIAIQGEINDGHVPPSYSNIAVMYGALLDFGALHHPEWRARATAWTEEVHRLFALHNSFDEYNSPTYYGVDLFGLALWRSYGSTPRMRSIGAEMEAALWNDIADFYSPQLRNIAGPYDRAYGMDMESYVAVIGLWISTIVSSTQAPLPPISPNTNHVADLWFAPPLILLGARIPPVAQAKLEAFSGPHLVTRQIDKNRNATAWIGAQTIWGAEFTSRTLDTVAHKTQFHPVTVQWRTPTGQVGWIQLTQSPKIDAIADRNGITIDTLGDVTFHIMAAGAIPSRISAKTWNLPGIHVAIDADQKVFVVDKSTIDVTYRGVSHIRLDFAQPSQPHYP